jgi:Tol biopolymer transport system component
MLASANRGGFQGRAGKLFLFDLPGRGLAAEIPLGEKTFVGEPAFSPDGKWIAVPTQAWPDGPPRGKADPEDLPQPRICLVEAAAGAVRETLVAPTGFAGCACFSPDGKTLATTSLGKVLLWDLSQPPGESRMQGDN